MDIMQLLYFIFVVLLGLVAGSFLNSFIYRSSRPEKVKETRSFCPQCRHILSWNDLIPLVSFLLLKGRCRYCGKKISLQYPLVETTTALLFALIFLRFSQFPFFFSLFNISQLVFYWFFACLLVVIFVYDQKYFIIPDKITVLTILSTGIWYLVQIFMGTIDFKEVIGTVFSAFGLALFFLFIFLLSRGKWLGFGDVKLAFAIGFFLGFPKILTAFFLTFFIGGIMGLALIIFKNKTLKTQVPLAPFLVIGTLAALFWGQEIINWYFGLFSG